VTVVKSTVKFVGTITAADAGERLITCRLVPFGAVGNTSLGPVVFAADGTHLVKPGHVLNLEHDRARPLGRMVEANVGPDGIDVVYRISRTTAGDDALVEAADGLRSGVSVEASVTDSAPGDGSLMVTASTVIGAALTFNPAYADAQVTEVAATEAEATDTETEGNVVDEATSTTEVEVEATQPAPSAKPLYAARTQSRPLPTPGEYLYASVKRTEAPQAWEDMQAIVKAAAPHTFVADVPGLLPEAIVGDVFAGRPEDRPILSSLGPNVGPDGGKTFSRPFISDFIADAVVATEKSDVTDQIKVEGADFTYSFIKRAFNLSAEAIAFTSPQILDVAVRDLGRAYSRGTEKVAATAIASIDSSPTSVAADALEAALYAAAAAMYGSIGEMPDRLWVAPDVWGFIANAKDADKRPLYPRLSPSNAGGSNSGGVRMFGIEVAGLPVTVSWALTAGFAAIGSSAVIEGYENHRVQMRADEPTILGTAVGIGGAVAVGTLNEAGLVAYTVTAQTP
jgi:hypothetical protein